MTGDVDAHGVHVGVAKRARSRAPGGMRQPQAVRRRVPRSHTALTSGEPRRALSRRDESTRKLRRLLPTPADDEVTRAALKGLPLRDRPSWLIEYLVDVNHLPNDPTPQPRRRSTERAQVTTSLALAVAMASASCDESTMRPIFFVAMCTDAPWYVSTMP